MSYEIAKKEIGDYRITIYQDEDAGCPCTDWDLAGVYFWDYPNYGYNRRLSCYCSSEVDAESEADALEQVETAYNDSVIVLDSDNYCGKTVEVEDDQQFYADYEKDYGETYQHID